MDWVCVHVETGALFCREALLCTPQSDSQGAYLRIKPVKNSLSV